MVINIRENKLNLLRFKYKSMFCCVNVLFLMIYCLKVMICKGELLIIGIYIYLV